MQKTIIKNGQIITPYRNLGLGYVVIEGGKILEVGAGEIELSNATVIDAQGAYIAPGFIDLHTHGAGNADFMDATVEAYLQAARTHAMHGTTLLYPTTLTSTNNLLFNTFDIYKEAKAKNTEGAGFGGIHLEGPYFAYEQRGAQDPRFLRNPDPKEYLEILERSDDIARWSIAPELPGALAFGRELVKRGIQPAIAHTNAIYEEVLDAFENGFRHITHFYSCMTGITRRNAFRYAGVIESGYLIDGMTVEIIADGVHVPESLLKLIYKIKGPENIALVTDSMRAAGMPEGRSILGGLKDGQEVLVEDGVAKLLDRTAFAGSVATADRLVRTMHQVGEVPLVDCVRMMTATPARIAGIDNRKGSLLPGKDADIVIFDENINIKTTIIEGNVIYKN
ncbi:MAG TPA: N-acetylglucosamine-6-phosphate deacetylase [Paludibacter sp.]